MRDGCEELRAFRARSLAGDRLVGTFQKTPSRQISEVLGYAGLDFIVLDGEHAPFGTDAVDGILSFARPAGLPILVRVPQLTSPMIGACLDAGASGIVVPHVTTASDATAAVSAARFAGGHRGLSPSGRSGAYGSKSLVAYMNDSDEAVCVWAQIEDAEAVDNVDEIAGTPGIDALFVGRADLMRSLGATSITDDRVRRAVARIAEAAVTAGVRLAIHIGGPEEAADFIAMGFSILICGSDQSLLKQATRSMQSTITDLN